MTEARHRIDNLRRLADHTNGETQKFLLQQALAGIADMLEGQVETDEKLAVTSEIARRNRDTLKNYGKGLAVIGTTIGLWLLNNLLGLI